MSLVEVLVSLVILSVGMLGVATLFVQSVRGSRTALFRTQAVNLVSDMADRIRANATAGSAYDLSTYSSAPSPHGCAPAMTASATVDAGNNCTIAQLAEDDLARWQSAVNDALPNNATVAATTDVQYIPAPASGPDRYRITLSWREAGEPPLSYSSDVVLIPPPPVATAAP
jgi:type IV pilus assembly protein PilV